MDSLLALATITQASNIEEMVNQRIHGRAAAEDLEEKLKSSQSWEENLAKSLELFVKAGKFCRGRYET